VIKAVLFDFGGVLTQSGKSGFVAETIAGLYGVRPQDMDIGDLHAALRRGKQDETYFLDELNRRYHGKVTPKQFVEKAHALTAPSAEVYELAEALRSRGIKTGIFSNVFGMNARELKRQGYYDGFDPLILSCDEGFAKPDKEFYKIAVERLGVRPEEILFIDDQPKCMPPAEKLGMHTIIAASPKQIVEDTKALVRRLNNLEL
jgi:putative hydrolase of the HAD superfamily